MLYYELSDWILGWERRENDSWLRTRAIYTLYHNSIVEEKYKKEASDLMPLLDDFDKIAKKEKEEKRLKRKSLNVSYAKRLELLNKRAIK